MQTEHALAKAPPSESDAGMDSPEVKMEGERIEVFPQCWTLLGFLFSKKTRERIFEPAQQDLLAQYAKARQFKAKRERCWLMFCFTVRTVGLVLSCYGLATIAAAASFAWRFVPSHVKEWIVHLFN